MARTRPPTAATLLTAALLAAALVPASGAPAGPAASEQLDPLRVVADVAGLPPGFVENAAEAAQARILRMDPRLHFAVFEAPDPPGLATELERDVHADRPAYAIDHLVLAHPPDDPLYAAQWNLHTLNMHQAWVVQGGTTAVRVAVIDSGIQADHPDFEGIPMTMGTDYVAGGTVTGDPNGHGTWVAGIVAAARDNGLGVAGMARLRIHAIRVLDASGRGSCANMASGIAEAADAGARVINLSLACSGPLGVARTALQYANSRGAIVVAGAGNHQEDDPDACVVYPARYPEAVAVGAVDPTLLPSSFSCQGPEVELAAPGRSVLSLDRGTGYAILDGTSGAAAHVSATAGLLASHQQGLTHTQIRTRLRDTAIPLRGPGERDEAYGYGLVSPVGALTGSPVYVPVPSGR